MIGSAHHIGVAVRRLEDALTRYQALGLNLESVEELPADGVRVAFLDAGGVRLELLEPLRPENAIARFLDKRGEGLHHVAFATPDILAEMDRLRTQGFDLIDREPRSGARGRMIAFIHPKSAHGVLLELVEEPSRSP